MRTVSSRHWGKVKRRKPQFKLEHNKDQVEKNEDKDSDQHRRRPIPRPVKKSWAEQHPMLLLMSAAIAGTAILAAIIYLIPKSSLTYDNEQRKQQPTLSHLKNDDKTGGPRAAPTDQSFLDTHYRRDSAPSSAMVPGGGSNGAASPASGTSNKPGSNAPNTSFGDGTVSRKDGNCQVSATGSGSFAGALADCVKSSSSGPAK